jgi:hypothetical protein
MPITDYLKRIWLWYFDTDKILESYKSRKGECKKCGKCCNFFRIKCPFLNKNKTCRIYKFRPTLLCKLPPLNIFKGEIEKHKKINCGFYWEKTKNHK